MERHQQIGGRHSPLPQGPPPFVVDPTINGLNRRPILDDRGDDRSPAAGQFDGEEEFPALGSMPEESRMGRQGSYMNDPGRTRFAGAVKKPPSLQPNPGTPAPIVVSGSKFMVQNSPEENSSLSPPSAHLVSPTPRPSPRITLRPPKNLPTIPTGEVLNKLYTTYRERPLQLQSARNACLARAADAWRRGDGAAAKRFSRDANDLNLKMAGEGREAAGKVVRERSRILREAVATKGAGGGRIVGNGLGIVLGLAEPSTKGESEEIRTEVAIDLHGLHATEGVDYLEELVMSLEQERFLGLSASPFLLPSVHRVSFLLTRLSVPLQHMLSLVKRGIQAHRILLVARQNSVWRRQSKSGSNVGGTRGTSGMGPSALIF